MDYYVALIFVYYISRIRSVFSLLLFYFSLQQLLINSAMYYLTQPTNGISRVSKREVKGRGKHKDDF